MSEENPAVVVGIIDGSASSESSALWASGVASAFDAPLHLVHSLPSTGHSIADAAVIAIRAASLASQESVGHQILEHAEQTVQQFFPELSISTELVADSAGAALVRASEAARLVVVGGDDVSPTAALLMGLTSLTVATRARCPVVAWRKSATPDTRPVVVGVDGTPAGTAALAAAFGYAAEFGAPIRAVHAWVAWRDAAAVAIPYYAVDWDAVKQEHVRILDEAVAPWRARHPDVELECFVEETKPGRALLEHSDGAQVVVVGNHWRSVVGSVTMGSVGLNLLHHSMIPVMVCHAGESVDR